MRRLAFVICLLCAWLLPSFASAQRIVAETFMIPATDPGIQRHVRNKRLEGRDTFPPSGSCSSYTGRLTHRKRCSTSICRAGPGSRTSRARVTTFYFVDIRGYGRSTRPAAMDAPPAENPPFATTADAVKDVGSAVEFILKRRSIPKLNLIGWSWGTALIAGYTMDNHDRVNKLVLYGPLWTLKAPPRVSASGAYRTVSGDSVRQRGARGMEPVNKNESVGFVSLL